MAGKVRAKLAMLAIVSLASVGGCVPAPTAAPVTPKAMPRPMGSPRPLVDRTALEALLKREVKKLPGSAAVHVRVDDGSEEGVTAGVAGDRSVPAASIAKVPLALALEQAWHDDRLKRTPEDLAHLRAALTVSSNASADALIGRLGKPAIAAWLREHGYRVTRLERRFGELARGKDNPTSAAEVTRMMLQISRGKAVSASASQELRTMLLAQTRRSRLPTGLPQEATCGNKTGTWGGAVNDVAFVEPPVGPRYAVAVFLRDVGSQPRAELAMARFSQMIYRFLAGPSGSGR